MSDTAALDPNNTYLVELQHQGLLAAEGPEASRFLQGQLTCDLRELPPHHTRLGAQCTLKGRMIANFRVLQDREDRVILRMHEGLVDRVQEALKKYIVFSKAELADISAQYRRLGITGPDAEALVNRHIGPPPAEAGDWSGQSDRLIIKLAPERYECWVAEEEAEHLVAELRRHCTPGDDNLWILLDIRAGLGEVRPQTREVFTPQALNYQLIGGISFRKGCYTGQEVVARLHYRGKLKRHMYRLGFDWPEDSALPDPGAPVPAAEGEASPGQIVMAARSENGRAEALAVLNDRVLEGEQIGVRNQKLQLLPLPYAIPTE